MGMRDADLVARVRAGDRGAYRLLVEEYGRRVFRLAYRITGHEQDAEDVVQETFMRAYRRLDLYDSRSGFGSWLFRIATNSALDLLRVRKRRGGGPEPAGLDDPGVPESATACEPMQDRQVFGGEVQGRVARAMRRLSDRERAAFVLRHFQERPIKEVARTLGQTDNATKQALFRAVRKLRRELEPERSGLRMVSR
jgi:RNA polymerase sigma-70 factor (ECF subfamily)